MKNKLYIAYVWDAHDTVSFPLVCAIEITRPLNNLLASLRKKVGEIGLEVPTHDIGIEIQAPFPMVRWHAQHNEEIFNDEDQLLIRASEDEIKLLQSMDVYPMEATYLYVERSGFYFKGRAKHAPSRVDSELIYWQVFDRRIRRG